MTSCNRFFILLSALLLLLSSCSPTVETRAAQDSFSVTEALANAFPIEGGYAAYDENALRLYFRDAPLLAQDFSVIYSVRPDDYTEIGVFRVADDKYRRTVAREVNAYLEEFKETYLPQAELYDKNQKVKLSDAALRIIDSYVIYTVMSEKEQRLFWKNAESLLL